MFAEFLATPLKHKIFLYRMLINILNSNLFLDDCVDMKPRKHGRHKHGPKHRRKNKCSGKTEPGPKMPLPELPETKKPGPVPETPETKIPNPETPVPEVSTGECLTSNFTFHVNY